MRKLTFSELPWIARGAIAASYLALWVGFEKFIIEGFHWDAWLPYYRVQGFCIYDATFGTLLMALLIVLSRARAE
jgi:hypothetical protein